MLLGLTQVSRGSVPRSNFGLTVVLNDAQSPRIDLMLQLDSLTDNSTLPYWARYMTANLTLGSQLAWALDGPPGGSEAAAEENVSETAYFNFTAFIAPAMRENLTQHPNVTQFGTFTAVVVYTDYQGASPRTILRSVTFALNPPVPPTTPLVSLVAAGALGMGSAGTVGVLVYVVRRSRLEELYLMHDSGMLIRHWSRKMDSTHDSDILSGMLIVLQEFVRDTWKSHVDEDAPLEQLRFGTQRVILARGSHAVLAAVVSGRYLNGLPKKLQRTIVDFERSNAERLADWNGNVDVFPAVDQIAERFLHGRTHVSS